MRWITSPHALVVAMLVLGIVLGVSCWPRVNPAAVTATETPALPSPTVYVFWPSVTPTPMPDVFTVPPTLPPERLPATMLPSATPTPTTTPTLVPPPATETPVVPMRQRG